MISNRIKGFWAGLAVALALSGITPTAASQLPGEAADSPLSAAIGPVVHTEMRADGLHIRAVNRDDAATWPLLTFDDARLPGHFLFVELPAKSRAEVRLHSVSAAPFKGRVPTVTATVARETGDNPDALAESFDAVTRESRLPSAPVFVSQVANIGGRRFAKIAISGLHQSAKSSAAESWTSLEAVVPGALGVVEPNYLRGLASTQEMNAGPQRADSLRVNAPSAPDVVAIPPNTAAFSDSVKVTVSKRGIQRITGASLLGLGYGSIAPATMHIRNWGQDVAWQWVDNGSIGVFDGADEVRFYSANPGSIRTNEDFYWITFESGPATMMTTRSVTPGAGTLTTQVQDIGSVYLPNKYDSLNAGPDNDHFFTIRLQTGGGIFSANAPLYLTPTLPLAGGQATLAPQIEMYAPGFYSWTIGTGSSVTYTSQSLFTAYTPTIVLPDNPGSVIVIQDGGTYIPATVASMDRIHYTRTVNLDFAGNIGADFVGFAGARLYSASNVASAAAVYDITDPVNPIVLTGASAPPSLQFSDAPASAKRYLVTGNTNLITPAIVRNFPNTILATMNVQALYLGLPGYYTATLPLVALRQSQGYSSAFVDVQSLYDAWTYGYRSVEAIRNYLRYANSAWASPPIAATLIGDTTYDPRNYLRSGSPDLMPIWMLPTKPVLLDYFSGETGCDSCFGQLDGDTLAFDWSNANVLPDVFIGRISISSTTDLSGVVSKIVGYEAQPISRTWMSRAGYLSDNFYKSDGSDDPAGDFYSESDSIAAFQPGWMTKFCNYYLPSNRTPPPSGGPCYVTSPSGSNAKAIDMYNSGASLMVYIGHSNETTQADLDSGYKMLQNADISALTNGLKLPVVLQLTCLTSHVERPAPVNQVIDEKLLINPNGGAIGTFGGSGKSVTSGHVVLADGFVTKMWEAGKRPRLGDLTQAAYTEIFVSNEYGSKLLLWEFFLLGDPLTRVKKIATQVYVPTVSRSAANGW